MKQNTTLGTYYLCHVDDLVPPSLSSFIKDGLEVVYQVLVRMSSLYIEKDAIHVYLKFV